jgi:hypothetical protein
MKTSRPLVRLLTSGYSTSTDSWADYSYQQTDGSKESNISSNLERFERYFHQEYDRLFCEKMQSALAEELGSLAGKIEEKLRHISRECRAEVFQTYQNVHKSESSSLIQSLPTPGGNPSRLDPSHKLLLDSSTENSHPPSSVTDICANDKNISTSLGFQDSSANEIQFDHSHPTRLASINDASLHFGRDKGFPMKPRSDTELATYVVGNLSTGI